ncbi:MAG: HD domain-containing protein [Treponema sp.]|jgi:HD superfamily phosphohydrolase|nr:HD domain-containing protein [Treponema sp.]
MNNNAWTSLREGYTEPVRDVLWGHIYLTPALAALTKSVPFTRLTRIFQLGPAYTVYPGATHTRASHSIGVYQLARRLLTNLAERGADAWLSAEGVKSFLCACLLHDLGHFPYTHSLKELPLRSHESLTASLILTEPLKTMIGRAGADPCLTAAIVDDAGGGGSRSGFSGGELSFYQKLLSGCLDPDKLDYLNRDARYCGVPYGAQDVDFIFSRIYPHLERGIDIDSKGIPSVESILFSKYLMYRSVYWHREVRSATAMIKKALLGGLADGIIKAEELYGLDDQGLFSLVASRNYPLFSLVDRVRNGQLYAAVAEFPFDEAAHGGFEPIGERRRYEADLAAELSVKLGGPVQPGEIIIDVPEPVTFETGLYVTDEEAYFGGAAPECSSVFKAETVRDFAKILRIVRIFVDPIHENKLKLSNRLVDILNIRYNKLTD